MIYIAVFIVIIAIIVLIWIARLVYYKARATQLQISHDPEAQIRERALVRPTFQTTAADVSERVFPTYNTQQRGQAPYRPRENGEYGVQRADRGAVNRGGADDGDPELPSYNDNTTLSIPPQAYATPEQLRRETPTTNVPIINDAPPKYA